MIKPSNRSTFLQRAYRTLFIEHRVPWAIKGCFLPHEYYYVVSIDPLIVLIVGPLFEGRKWMGLFFEQFKDKKVYFIVRLHWTVETDNRSEEIKKWCFKYAERYPRHQFIYLANTPKEEEMLKCNGISAVFCNHNAFIDEKRFRTMPEVEKKYDALYNARMVEFKRHYLACQVERLALVTCHSDRGVLKDMEFLDRVKKILPQASMLNWPKHPFIKDCSVWDYEKIPNDELPLYLNQAKVGLCLSAKEGANYSSMEYLLCGLPVVSTQSTGGRDVFFDDECAVIVEDRPGAVQKGVAEMLKRNIPAERIRSNAIEKIKIHRERFIRLIQGIYDKEGRKKSFIDEWDKVFHRKMLCAQRIDGLQRCLKGDLPIADQRDFWDISHAKTI